MIFVQANQYSVPVRGSDKLTMSLSIISQCVCVPVHTSFGICVKSAWPFMIVLGTIQAPSMSADNVMKTLRHLTQDKGYQCAVRGCSDFVSANTFAGSVAIHTFI